MCCLRRRLGNDLASSPGSPRLAHAYLLYDLCTRINAGYKGQQSLCAREGESLGTRTCDTCDSQCATAGSSAELSPTKRCRCDALCAAYGDCCSGRPTCADDASSLDGLQCKRTENIFLDRYIPLSVGLREAYWMISSCPEEWLASGDAQRSEISSNCNASYARFPPVSDYNTGVVYKNEYCAVCNGVEKSVRWRYGLGCTRWLSRELQLANESSVVYNLTVDLLYRECIPCSYEPPDLPSLAPQPRACYPHIDSCLGPENVAMPAEEYRLAASQCASEPLNPVWAKVGSRVLCATQGDCEVSSRCHCPVLWEWSGASPRPPFPTYLV